MSELDIETLKRWNETTPAKFRMLSRGEVDAIIAALEDRDRLRAAVDSITHVTHVEHGIHTQVSVWVNHAKAGTLILRTEEYKVFRAALEGRDG